MAMNNPTKRAIVNAGKHAGRWAVQRVRPEPPRPEYGKMALEGLAAALVALPVGIWLGRRMGAGR
jgi:hypothetical protein